MSAPRKIVGLAGMSAQFALAEDGSCWFWTGTHWTAWGRPNLPDDPDKVLVHPVSGDVLPPPPKVEPFNPNNPPPVKRGPGRPRKVQP